MKLEDGRFIGALGLLFKGHPWHGIMLGDQAPDVVTSYIEVVPADTVKYELDKRTGLLRVDRPQKYSNTCPCLYGLLPRTLCAEEVAERAKRASGREFKGDDDPIDVCVLTDRNIMHGNILVEAIPIGGIRLIDGDEVDDKIIAVLQGDSSYGDLCSVEECPPAVISRLRHYFLTYKQAPNGEQSPCEILEIYGREEAQRVISAGIEDYQNRFAGLPELIAAALQPFSQSA